VQPLELDVAVVGAGVSGLYTAWRLATEQAGLARVHVFEMLDRVGGRLESIVLPKMEIAGELGGMRYMDSQAILATLIEDRFEKTLKSVPFPMGDSSNRLFYGRGQRCLMDAWTKAQAGGTTFKTRYFLPVGIEGFNADQLFNKAIYDVLVADPSFVSKYGSKVSNPAKYEYSFQLTAADWDGVKPSLRYCFAGPYEKMYVNDLGFWNVLKDQCGQEAYEFLSVAGGYYSNTINWNAAEAFPYMVGDFSNADTSYKTIEGGFDLIAYSLAHDYLSTKEAAIWTGHALVTFECNSENVKRRYRLVFRNVETEQHVDVYADRIVLAMPRRSLELLDQHNFFFDAAANPDLQQNLVSSITEPAFKLLMAFESPWWQTSLNAKGGVSVTDLPMRQCYYFGTNPNDGHSLFLAAYNDMDPVAFWGPLEHGRGITYKKFPTRSIRSVTKQQLDELQSTEAPEVIVAEAMKQVRELHGDENIPDPYAAYFKDWSVDPFGAGYHAWKAATDVKSIMKSMRHPHKEHAIHICGEAYSGQQGWVEGALCVAERMLEEHFGLGRPEWLERNYYLGW
jgi:monoamine oxidase